MESYEGVLVQLNNVTVSAVNDFDWAILNGPTPSNNTGPGSSYEGDFYIYTEASGSNHPYKTAAIISPCINLSEYNNPVLDFWYHMYDTPPNYPGQGTFSVDISTDNGVTWTDDIWFRIVKLIKL